MAESKRGRYKMRFPGMIYPLSEGRTNTRKKKKHCLEDPFLGRDEALFRGTCTKIKKITNVGAPKEMFLYLFLLHVLQHYHRH